MPIFGTDVDASALRAAAKLVGEGATVEAVYILRVPNQLSLDAGLDEEEQLGLSVLESAKLAGPQVRAQGADAADPHPEPGRGDRRGGRSAGTPRSSTWAPPTRRRRSARSVRPPRYLLAHRPCRVVIETAARRTARERRVERRPPRGARARRCEPSPGRDARAAARQPANR